MSHVRATRPLLRRSLAAAALALLLGAGAPTASAAMYTILDLGTLGGTGSTSNGFGTLNATGQVVGNSTTAGGQTRAFRTAANAVINAATDNLGTLGGTGTSTANAVNAIGQAVGYAYTAAGGLCYHVLNRAVARHEIFRHAGDYANENHMEDASQVNYEKTVVVFVKGC